MIKKLGYYILVIALILGIIGIVEYNKITIANESKNMKEVTQKTEVKEKNVTINCIGDTLTLGSKETSYPKILSTKGFTVNEYAVDRDESIDAAIRLHGYPVYCRNITIPDSTEESVDLTIRNSEGKAINVLQSEGYNFDTVTIDGIKGKLAYDRGRGAYTFTRSEEGESHQIDGEVEIIADKYPKFNQDDIAVIWLGNYDRYHSSSIDQTVTHIKEIIDANKIDKYVVVSLTSKRKYENIDKMNSVLEENFKEHYLDFRGYLLTNGLKDAAIEATTEDQDDLSNDRIPASLLDESELLGNSYFNELLTKQLINKMEKLGYISEDQIK